MKYRVLKGVNIGRGRTVQPGDVLDGGDVDELLLRNLVARACVAPVEAAPAPSPKSGGGGEALAADEVLTREPEPENREPRTRHKEK